MEYAITVKTDVGTSRATNQDCLFVRTASSEGKNYAFAVVCDGMGGLSNGEYASRLTVQALSNWFETGFASWLSSGCREDVLTEVWLQLLRQCNTQLLAYGQEHNIELGTTATALLLTPERYAILHLGDTRVYELRSQLIQLTQDHTLAERMIADGQLSRLEARNSRESHVLTRCIGVDRDVNPDFLFGDARVESIYLLCSDGFRNTLTEAEITEAFSPKRCMTASNLQESCARMLCICKEREETDNISIIAIRTYGRDSIGEGDREETIILE